MGLNKFLLHVLAFVAVVLLLFLIPCAYYSWYLNHPRFNEIPGKKIVFIGDSHIETSMNDRVDSTTFNLAQSAECYLYSYIKLRKLLPLNPEIKIVILGYSDLNLHEDMDAWYFKDQPLQNKVANNLFLMRPAEISLLLRHNLSATLGGIANYPKRKYFVLKNIKVGAKINSIGVGGFQPQTSVLNKLGDPEAARRKMQAGQFRFSVQQLMFIDKIVNLCNEQGVQLVLLSTPLHKSYQTGSANSRALHAEKYSGIPFIDLTSYTMPDSAFADYEHLNETGAALITRLVLDSLRSF